jgi:geranylgeranyl diphosphate synthase, type II
VTSRGPDALARYLSDQRARIDQALDRFLPSPPACPPLIGEAMRYSVFAGGKRFRPVLALAAADATAASLVAQGEVASGPAEHLAALALPAACAIELIHTYSLIHDDLPAMDNDTLRRGRPTLHVVYGEGLAILAGDGLLAEAFALLAREPVGDDPALLARKLRTIQLIAEAAGAAGMVGGQAIDLLAASPSGAAGRAGTTLDREGLRRMDACKTGALIRAAAVSGVIMPGGHEPMVTAVDRYAAELGLAFQIVDDILDVEGSTADLGKTAGKDAAAGKPTYPALHGLEESRRLARECLARATSALDDAGLAGGRLQQIAEWVVSRTS